MLPLAAYADRLSVRPGETIRFHLANATGTEIRVRMVRVICADANPAGPGIRVEALNTKLDWLDEAGPGHVPSGSYVRVDGAHRWLSGGSFTVACRVFPALLDRPQALVCAQDPEGGTGFALMITRDGRLRGGVGTANSLDGPTSAAAFSMRRWHVAWLCFDADRGVVQVGHHPIRRGAPLDRPPDQAVQTIGAHASATAKGPLLIGAAPAEFPFAHFNGKLERPTLWDRALSEDEIRALAAGGEPAAAVATWDFSQAISSNRVVDTGPDGVDGTTVNTPARGMTGSNWSAREMCFRHAPQEYGAIYFHEDDIDDCQWPATLQWTVPDDTQSAVYALTLSAGDEEENVPFHVVPPKGATSADIAVLASTFTYTVYGNHARPEWERDPAWRDAWRAQSARWGGYPDNAAEHVEYGLSTYNRHPDDSGIHIASWHRPMLNVRIGYLSYPDEEIRASGLRHFPADSHLTAWLEAKDHGYDVITDWELHHEGVELLERYRIVLTGTHPEYHTPAMIDALESYRDGGGRFCYLGGNGFYWKVALSPERDGVIEIRRGEGGIRAWAAEPGEYYNQFDGEYGGLWRRNGRPPQNLCGVGFTAQGNFLGSYYRRRPQAGNPRVAWMFEGVEGEVIGDHGLSGHGAAGFELDRTDKRLGTPEHAVVVASSENHPPDAPWVLVPEEHLTHIVTWPGEPAEDLIRADMTFFETAAGGAVFSTGSITFCGSLVTNEFDNDVSRLLDNVIRRFLEPTPFEMPDS